MAELPDQLTRVHEVFESLVDTYADKDAVVCSGQRISYRTLNERANRLAHFLIGLGVQHEEPVGVAIPKSCDLIIAMMGVLKAGAAYVPLAESLPTARLREVIDDAGCTRVVSIPGHLDPLWTNAERVITLDETKNSEATNPGLAGAETDLAYVLYTSGSTGEPKGVQVEHAGVVRLVRGQDYMPFNADTNHIFLGPISFDLSTLGIYAPLLNGSTMVIEPELIPDADELAELIRNERVGAGMVIFGMFTSLFEARPELFEPMSTVLVGGEAVSASVMRRAMQRLPNTRFVNAYGPTEA
ncbi:MAG: AMP-binding protein, partial [Phycisphaerales bacterium]|nr:AMP-binding protein [Phycisphaerales bacterium]